MNNTQQKLVNILSIACRAGKVMSGEFVIEKALSGKNNIKLFLIASDVAEATREKYHKLVQKHHKILLRDAFLTKDMLAASIGKTDRAVVAVCDEGFCKAILKILDNE